MENQRLRKNWRKIRIISSIGLRDSCAPFFDRFALWALLQLPVNITLLGWVLGTAVMVEEMTIGGVALIAFVVTLPVWFLINFIRAPFIFVKEQQELGQWRGDRFVFHTPMRVATILREPSEGPVVQEVPIPYCEKNSFVGVSLKTTAPAHLTKMVVTSHGDLKQFNPSWGFGENFTTGGVRVGSSKSIFVAAQLKPNTDLVTIRVYLNYWEW